MRPFAQHIIRWQRQHGRHALPWQGRDAYCVWLSEIMLQQTQVATVIPYYLCFVARFPDIETLAKASEDEVLAHWSGLGYYSRARNLHRAALVIMRDHAGKFPRDFDAILALPGIGRSTAAAIVALAFHGRRAILDGNVKRVLARYCGVSGYPGEKHTEELLWQQAEALLPPRDVAVYTQGLMDLGATVCTRGKPRCDNCPLRENCVAHQCGLTGQLPTPRPKKTLPEKHCTLLLLLDGAHILLEKRPGNGIWGGLWCAPQLNQGQDISAYCAQQFGVSAAQIEALPDFTHTFTHFRLHIAPRVVRVNRSPSLAQEPGRVWLEADEALHAAIPAPLRKLLRGLRSQGGA
jgi:A/G-specific adenine glycosylase